jgi:hypothetical protein
MRAHRGERAGALRLEVLGRDGRVQRLHERGVAQVHGHLLDRHAILVQAQLPPVAHLRGRGQQRR